MLHVQPDNKEARIVLAASIAKLLHPGHLEALRILERVPPQQLNDTLQAHVQTPT